MPTPAQSSSSNTQGPAWRVALFFPEQGGWTENDYLGLQGGPLVEYDQGCVEILDMPTKEHQRIVQFLFLLLQNYVSAHRCGETFIAPLPVRLWTGKYREPDVVFINSNRGETNGYPDGADLVMEVISEGNESRRRDLQIKPQEYAQAGVTEYWIIDPQQRRVIVNELSNQLYRSTTYELDSTAISQRLPGFNVPVSKLFQAADGPQP